MEKESKETIHRTVPELLQLDWDVFDKSSTLLSLIQNVYIN